MQINQIFACYPKMNFKYIAIVAVIAVTLVGATAFATDSAFADGKKRYEKNQVVSQANACGNGELGLNIGCQNKDSHFDGEENIVSLASDQTFPAIHNNEPEPK
jgi:hypothetical protein